MKTEQILMLDYRKEENVQIIQKVLRQVKPLSKYSDEELIPIEALEKTVSVLSNKYSIQPQWITCSYVGQVKDVFAIYSVGVKTSDTHAWLGTVNAHIIYELFAKLVVFMYAQVRSGKIEIRQPSKEEAEREKLAKQIDEAKEEREWDED